MPILVLAVAATIVAGCADRKTAEQKAREEIEAKARAEAARKEMETVPKVFRPQYHNKRLDPEPKSPPPPATQPTSKQ